ncbi:MAG: O-antigen/teichoic acid export membrane protein [Marinoscillum sp.]|jgi:O-antigen/teichoic acid export membrane protein
MGIVIRQSFWASLITYVGISVGYINSLILFPYFLDVERYGLVRLVQSNGMILIPLALIGMNGVYTKYFPEFKDNPKLSNQIISFQLVIIFLGGLFFSSLVFLFRQPIETFYAEKSSLYNDYLYVTVVIFLSQSLFNYFIAFLWSRHQIIFTNFIQEVVLRLASTGLIALYGFGFMTFPMLVLWLGMTYIIATVIIFLYIGIFYNVRFDTSFIKLPKVWIRKMFTYGGYVFLVTTSASILTNVSYLITASYLGLAANAILTISVFIATVIELPRRAMAQILSPVFSQLFNDNDKDGLRANYQLSSLNLGLIGALVAIGIVTNLDGLFNIIPKGEIYIEGYWVIVIIVVARVFAMFGGMTSELITFSDFYKWNLFISISGAIIMIALNLVLIPVYGIIGSAIGTLGATSLTQVVRQILIYKQIGLVPYNIKHFLILPLSGIVLLIALYLPKLDNSYFDIFYRSTITTLIFTLLAYVMRISIHVNMIIDSTLRWVISGRRS